MIKKILACYIILVAAILVLASLLVTIHDAFTKYSVNGVLFAFGMMLAPLLAFFAFVWAVKTLSNRNEK